MPIGPKRKHAAWSAALVLACIAALPGAHAGTPDRCGAASTPIPAVQGTGAAAALTGIVTVEGIVVGDYEGARPALRGFYLQSERGDGDAATSDAIFVFNASSDSVAVGDRVRVTGEVTEFEEQTQVGAASIVKCGTGRVAPTDVTLPFPSADWPERLEGMLVRFPQTLYVTEHFQLGRFGQVVLSSGGRLVQPTQVQRPGAAAIARQRANELNRIILDDASNQSNPDPIAFGRGGRPLSATNTLRAGDTATGIVGVLTYTWAGNAASGNAWRVRPLGALSGAPPAFVAANPRPVEPRPVGGTLRVASANLLNWFNTFADRDPGTPGCYPGGRDADCRGANSAAEFERQAAKTVAALLALDADVVGVIEVENDGYGPTSALQELVGRLNAAARRKYAFIDADARTGRPLALGTDAIKVGLLYRPDAVRPVGRTAALGTDAFVNGGDPAPRNRAALAQAFEQPDTRERFVVTVNHLKSKGSPCAAPDAGDGQGNCAAVRTRAVAELRTWLASDPTRTGDPDVLIVGDLNSYAEEDPVRVLHEAGYVNLLGREGGAVRYGFGYEGQWGELDHAFASPSLAAQVTGAATFHSNADEPAMLDYNVEFKSPGQQDSLYAPTPARAADHDPLVIGLALRKAGRR